MLKLPIGILSVIKCCAITVKLTMQWTMLDLERCFETDKMAWRIKYDRHDLIMRQNKKVKKLPFISPR